MIDGTCSFISVQNLIKNRLVAKNVMSAITQCAVCVRECEGVRTGAEH